MPPRSLIGTLFAAAALLWWLLIGVLLALAIPQESVLGVGFWIGAALAAGTGFGWGAALGHTLAHRLPAKGRTHGLVRFAGAGAVLLLLAGATALLAGLALSALFAGAEPTWSAVRQALARPAALALPVAAFALIGAPIGAAAGVVLRALAAPGDRSSATPNGSQRRPLR